MSVNLKQNIDIDENMIDFINRKKLKYKLAPFNLFSIDYNYIEKGITAGGIFPLFGDVIYDFKDKIFRMENVKYIGYTNKQLSQILEWQITTQEVQIILMSFCFVFVGWALLQDLWQWVVNWKKKKQNYQLKDVKQIYMIFGGKVKANCEVCKINLKSTFYLPCLHSVICEQCSQRNQRNKFYEDSKQVEQCQICDKKINEVIHIYNV
ncbi:hypothetical protein PPERSA_09247 [Pseudocohnilembus persalinus]|uniref:RING-type domain-containing protein n=1 Tax=Pseudocohnilembus persalinus TaxID=266149 RepID=A0A0V0QLN5_PSEPJ|nr:hypothetical protein PPERSA_09247 [Pseudocohnilembus persalinus]|eukprot:KRX03235.1 hypothetical protein PPERSA_09247 [Pseudocohnilembus persalinus]